LISLSGISKVIDRRTILSDISFEAEKGKILCVLGPSGAGKTTLLRILAFLERQSSGQYCFDGEAVDFNNLDILRHRITMVFQKPILFNTSVFENVAFGLEARGMKREDIKRVVGENIEMVGMQRYETESALKLSGGEGQRIALARAFAIRPDVLLLDEPTANLDPANVSIVEDIIKRFNDSGSTIIIATHNIPQAERLSDKILFLLDGRAEDFLEKEHFFTTDKEKTRAFLEGRMVY